MKRRSAFIAAIAVILGVCGSWSQQLVDQMVGSELPSLVKTY